jgi:hypothetical protein
MARQEIKSLPEPDLHIAQAFSLPARTILTCLPATSSISRKAATVRFEASAINFTHSVPLGSPMFSGISSRTQAECKALAGLQAMSILHANCSLEPSLLSNSAIEIVGGIAQCLADGIPCITVS